MSRRPPRNWSRFTSRTYSMTAHASLASRATAAIESATEAVRRRPALSASRRAATSSSKRTRTVRTSTWKIVFCRSMCISANGPAARSNVSAGTDCPLAPSGVSVSHRGTTAQRPSRGTGAVRTARAKTQPRLVLLFALTLNLLSPCERVSGIDSL